MDAPAGYCLHQMWITERDAQGLVTGELHCSACGRTSAELFALPLKDLVRRLFPAEVPR